MINQNLYAAKVDKGFKKILDSDFMLYLPFEKSDEQIILDAKNRAKADTNTGFNPNICCSLLTIKSVEEREFRDKNYKVVNFSNQDGDIILTANYSQFKYRMCINTFDHYNEFDGGFNSSEAYFLSGIDDMQIDPNAFEKNIDCEILFAYKFSCINKYGKQIQCLRLYDPHDSLSDKANILRKQILRTQAFILNLISTYPAAIDIPFDNSSACAETAEISKERFAEFRQQYKERLTSIITELNKRGWTYEENIQYKTKNK